MYAGRGTQVIALGGVGIVLSTLQLCSIWAALGGGPYYLRCGVSIVCGLTIALGGVLGLVLASGVTPFSSSEWINILLVGCAVGPLLWFTGQIPLLIMRYAFGWHIQRQTEDTRLTILDLMLVTAIAAMVVGMLQLVAGLISEPSLRIEDFLPAVGVSVAIVAGSMLLFVMPSIYVTLRRDKQSGCLTMGIYSGVVGAFLLLGLMTVRAAAAAPILCILLLGYAFFLGLPLAFFREAGFVLWTSADGQGDENAEGTVAMGPDESDELEVDLETQKETHNESDASE